MSSIQNSTEAEFDDLDGADAWRPVSEQGKFTARRLTKWLVILAILSLIFCAGSFTQKRYGANSSNSSAARSALANFANRARGAGGFGGATAATGGARGGTGAAAGITTGQVTLIDGSNVYITMSDGSVVKVAIGSSATLSKQTTASLADIKPGSVLTVRGSTDSQGTVQATSVQLANN